MSTTQTPVTTPTGEFVNEDLARDCARFLAEIKKRAVASEGFRPATEK